MLEEGELHGPHRLRRPEIEFGGDLVRAVALPVAAPAVHRTPDAVGESGVAGGRIGRGLRRLHVRRHAPGEVRRQVPFGEVVEVEGAAVDGVLRRLVGKHQPGEDGRVVLGTDRPHQEAEVEILRPERVFAVRDRAPRVVAAHPGLAEVHRQGDLVARDEFGPVGAALGLAPVEVGDPVGQRGERQVGEADDQQPRAGPVRERRPAHVGPGARLLRPDVGVRELGHRRPVAAHRGAGPAVPVVLVGAAPVPLHFGQRLRQGEQGPEARHLGQVLVDAREARRDGHRSVAEDLVPQRVEGIHGTEREAALHHDPQPVLVLPHQDVLQNPRRRASRRLPDSRTRREAVPVVVVGRRPPEVGNRAGVQEVPPSGTEGAERAEFPAELQREAPAAHRDRVVRFPDGQGLHRRRFRGRLFLLLLLLRDLRFVLGGLLFLFLAFLLPGLLFFLLLDVVGMHHVHEELLPRHLVARRDQRRVLAGAEPDGQQAFHQGFDLGLRNVEGDDFGRSRRGGDGRHLSLGDHHPVRGQLPASREVGEIGEGAEVLDLDQPRTGVERPDPDGLVDLLDLEGVRMGLPVGRDQSVHQEVPVGGDPRWPDVPPVGPEGPSGFVLAKDRLVHPVPDEPADQLRIGVDHLPIVGQVPHAVAHGVRVLDEQEGLFRPGGGVVLEPVGTDVHGSHDVHDVPLAGRLVEDRPPGVVLPDPLRGGVEVLAVAGLVAERPDDHRRVVPVPDDHPFGAVEVRVPPLGTRREGHLGQEAHPVRLDVRLVHHVEPVLVGQLVEAGQVWVVRRPDRVDVEPLHKPDVLEHPRLVHHVAPLGVVFVPVHAPEHDRTAVQEQLAVRRLDPPEAHPDRGGLGHRPAGAGERQDEPVEVRGLGGPGADVRDGGGGPHGGLAAGGHVELQHLGAAPEGVAFRVEQLVAHFVGSRRPEPPVRDVHAEVQDAVAVAGDEVGARREVTDEGGWPGKE